MVIPYYVQHVSSMWVLQVGKEVVDRSDVVGGFKGPWRIEMRALEV